jgi:REP-associated tyrosine transposase
VPNRPPRVSGFSYIGLHCYFLTICCDRRCRAFEDDDAATWLVSQIVQGFPADHFAVIAYCVMPDHVHLLLEGLRDDADLPVAMHNWKQRTAFIWKQTTGNRLGQSGYYDYVVRDEDSIPSIVKYIVGNPVRARLVDDASQYPYTGSTRYRFEELAEGIADWQSKHRRA